MLAAVAGGDDGAVGAGGPAELVPDADQAQQVLARRRLAHLEVGAVARGGELASAAGEPAAARSASTAIRRFRRSRAASDDWRDERDEQRRAVHGVLLG